MKTLLPVVTTIETKCKRCYSCIRKCPAKAIKVEKGQAMVIAERCIACGYCVKVCPQNAKKIRDDINPTLELLASENQTYAVLAPSFPAAFPDTEPGKIITAIRKLGFTGVYDVAFGADLVSEKYRQLLDANIMPFIISSPCPAVVNYIEKYYPFLTMCLAPIVSPMIAIGRYIKQYVDKNAFIVFIGPCIAKKKEMGDSKVENVIQQVLTFDELKNLFVQKNIQPGKVSPGLFDGPESKQGKLFPVSGGLLKSAELNYDITVNDIIVTEGRDRVLEILQRASEGQIEAKFLDLLFCEGCINGPKIDNNLSVFVKKDKVINYINSKEEKSAKPCYVEHDFSVLHLGREFTNEYKDERIPSEKEIKRIMRLTGINDHADELNCGACGYISCREKAIAVYQGLAEADMCLPYMLDKLESVQNELQISNLELKDSLDRLKKTQQQLIQSERLASIGELAAGVAHELNNPLGGVLIFSSLLLERKKSTDPEYKDLKKILEETERCRKIVLGLLDFSRQSRLQAAIADLNKILISTLSLIENQVLFQNIKIIRDLDPDVDKVFVDVGLIQQIFLNIIFNAAEAMDGRGTLIVKTDFSPDKKYVLASFKDTGPGISTEMLDKIFDPFFTTKPPGKGTGLGLSISYGIIKKHNGDILVQSKVGKGTRFTIKLPTALIMKDTLQVNKLFTKFKS